MAAQAVAVWRAAALRRWPSDSMYLARGTCATRRGRGRRFAASSTDDGRSFTTATEDTKPLAAADPTSSTSTTHLADEAVKATSSQEQSDVSSADSVSDTNTTEGVAEEAGDNRATAQTHASAAEAKSGDAEAATSTHSAGAARSSTEKSRSASSVASNAFPSSLFAGIAEAFSALPERIPNSMTKAPKMLRRFTEATPTSLLNRMIEDFRARRYQQCLQYFVRSTSHDVGVEPTNATLLYALASASHIDYVMLALKLLDDMEAGKYQIPPEAFSLVMQSCERRGNKVEATELLQRMRRHHISPTLETYNMAISCAVQEDDHDLAFRFLREMQSDGIEPDEATFAHIVLGMNTCESVAKAIRRLEQMSLTVPISMYAEILGVLASDQHDDLVAVMLQQYEQVKEKNPAVFADGQRLPIGTYEELLRVSYEAINVDLSLKLWTLMQREYPGEAPTADCFLHHLNALGYVGDFESAFSILTMSDAPEFSISDLNGLVRGMSRSAEEIDNAYYMLQARKEKSQPVNLLALNAVIAACAQVADVTRAMDTLAELSRTFGLTANVDSYNEVFRASCLSGAVDHVSTLAIDMRKIGLTPTSKTFEILSLILIRSQRPISALAMVQNGTTLGVAPTLRCLDDLARKEVLMVAADRERSGMRSKLKTFLKSVDYTPQTQELTESLSRMLLGVNYDLIKSRRAERGGGSSLQFRLQKGTKVGKATGAKKMRPQPTVRKDRQVKRTEEPSYVSGASVSGDGKQSEQRGESMDSGDEKVADRKENVASDKALMEESTKSADAKQNAEEQQHSGEDKAKVDLPGIDEKVVVDLKEADAGRTLGNVSDKSATAI